MLWFWTPGGQEAESRLARKLGRTVKFAARDLKDWYPGALEVSIIPLGLGRNESSAHLRERSERFDERDLVTHPDHHQA
jgi:hypothetical protein